MAICCKYPRVSKRCNFVLARVSSNILENNCSLWFDSGRPLVICQKMEMSGDQREGEMCVCRKHPEFCQHRNYYLQGIEGGGVLQYFWRNTKWYISLAASVIPFSWIWQSDTPPPLTTTATPPRGGRCSLFLTMRCFNDAMFSNS